MSQWAALKLDYELAYPKGLSFLLLEKPQEMPDLSTCADFTNNCRNTNGKTFSKKAIKHNAAITWPKDLPNYLLEYQCWISHLHIFIWRWVTTGEGI